MRTLSLQLLPISCVQGIAMLFESCKIFDEHVLACRVLAHTERNVQQTGRRVLRFFLLPYYTQIRRTAFFLLSPILS